MADVTSLSDAKLRSELTRLGFTPGPVTNTTRSILQKKLVKLRSEQKKPAKRASIAVPSRKVLGLSSDESENDTGSRSARNRQATLRRRSARGRLTTAALKKNTKEESDEESNDENVDDNLPSASSFSFLKRSVPPKPQPNVRPSDVHTGYAQSHSQTRPNSSIRSHQSIDAQSPPNTSSLNAQRSLGTPESQFEKSKSKSKRNSSLFSRQSFLASQPANEFSDSDVDHDSGGNSQKLLESNKPDASSTNNSRSRRATPSSHTKQNSLLPNQSGLNRTFDVDSNTVPDGSTNVSSVSRRQSLNSTPKTSTPRKLHSFNRTNSESVIGNRPSSTTQRRDRSDQSSFLQPGEQSSLPEQAFATEENLSSSLASKYSHVISTVLLVCAFMFFVILGVLYISVGSEDLPDRKLLGCTGACDEDREFKITKAILDKLCERNGLFQCGYLKEHEDDKLTKEDLIKHLEGVFATEDMGSNMWPHDSLNEFMKNASSQEWGVRFFDKEKTLLEDVNRLSEIHYLSSEHPAMPWLCRVKRSASVVLFRLGVIFLVLLSIWLSVLYMKYYWRKQEEEREKVHAMVEKILDMLAKHHRACQNDTKNNHPYQAIPHVRDSIIAPAERQKLQRIWNKSVQFINTHESRVRVETQRIEGEEFQVWRWVQAVTPNTRTSFAPVMELELNPNRQKVWQGTAFDNPEAAVKMRSYSPTECLKIRNMFDISLESTEHWEIVIEDAVLERCGPDHGIVHVAADKTSTEGCVYVKFVSPDKAGQGFRKLHGSWFDGKLITVKFLRLERYHTRFPQASRALAPIKPSNNLQKSLSAVNRPSGDDAT